MWETIDRHAPRNTAHRVYVAVAAGVVGVLALGDALHVITFPMYTLGLPDSPPADFAVFLLGVGLFAVTYRLLRVSVAQESTDSAGKPAADGTGEYDDRDPEQILEARYARGELTDDEFEHMRSRLEDYDTTDDAEYRDAQEFAENHELDDRETVIE
ncbi:MAG: SHOCT domain-containing protein [Haloarculaceae archaeon]